MGDGVNGEYRKERRLRYVAKSVSNHNALFFSHLYQCIYKITYIYIYIGYRCECVTCVFMRRYVCVCTCVSGVSCVLKQLDFVRAVVSRDSLCRKPSKRYNLNVCCIIFLLSRFLSKSTSTR